MKIITIEGRKIVIDGVGRLYFESGLPIPMAISQLVSLGYEVSRYHLACELNKQINNPSKTVHVIFDGSNHEGSSDLLHFLQQTYTDQRKTIFKYLFDDDIGLAKRYAHMLCSNAL